jgi:outer membrane protein
MRGTFANGLTAGAALLTAAIFPALVGAQQTPWSARLGVLDLQPANNSDPIPALGVPPDAIHVNNKAFPEFDVFYTFTPNIVAELVLTYPQKQEVTLNGAHIGSFKHLPPSLVAQYHFLPGQPFDPYVGAGLNFTWIMSVHLSVPGVGPLDLTKTSVGAALDVGGDYNLDKRWFVNGDIKYIKPLQSDVSAGGTKVSTVNLDPFLFSLGVGYRF